MGMYGLAEGVSAEQALRSAGWSVTPSRIAFFQRPFRGFGEFTEGRMRCITVKMPTYYPDDGGYIEGFLRTKHVTAITKMCK